MSVAIRTATRIQDQDDVNVTLGAGVDGRTLQYDSDSGQFVLNADYVMRDRFITPDGAPIINPRQAEPGPGWWTITDVEGVIKILDSRLRGGTQPASAVWGESRLVGQQVARVAGRTLAARITLQDAASDLAFGFATNKSTLDPSTDGHGWLMQNSGGLYAVADGVISVAAQPRHIKPMQYLVMIALDTTGAVVLLSTVGASVGTPMLDPLGIPQYPAARVVWIDRAGAASMLYPYVSFLDDLDNYPNGHAVEDVRIVDAAAWSASSWLATINETFTRANSATALGGNWLVDNGTWGIQNNQAYPVVGSGFVRAYLPNTTAAGDGIVMCNITVPNPATEGFGLMLRRQDANNYLRLFNNFTTNAIYLQTILAGQYGADIYATGQTWTPGQTYHVVVAMVGNKYSVWVDDVNVMDWVTDANSRFIAATANGLYGGNVSGARWDNFAVFPLTVTVPAEIQAGAVPLVYTGGATLASDTFTDTNTVRLNAHTAESGGAWTEHAGTWTIGSNKATWTTGGTLATATQECGQADTECQVEITTPASWSVGYMRAGIIGRYTDASNYLYARLFLDNVSQLGEDEIELIEMVAGSVSIVHKASLGNFFANSTTYTLKMQFKDDIVHGFLNGHPLISYYTRSTATGTRFGLQTDSIDDGCAFDNWSVKAL